jgi:phage protein D
MPATDPSRPDTVLLKVNGTALADAMTKSVISVRVEARMGVPAVAEIRLADPDFTILDGTTFAIGNAVTVTAGGSTVVFDGEILGLTVDYNPVTVTELVVTAYDKSHHLGHTTTATVHVNKKYSDIVSSIASAHGLRAQVDAMTVTHEFVVTAVNDYAVLEDLAFRTGAQWWVEGSTLYFKNRASGAPITIGADLIRRVRVRYSAAERTQDVKVQAWDPNTKRAIVGTNADAGGAPSAHVTTAPIARTGRQNTSSIAKTKIVRSIPAASQSEATQLAQAIGRRIASAETSMRLELWGKPELKPGSMVTLEDVGTSLAGNYYLSLVEHLWDKVGYSTKAEAGPLDPTGLVDLLGGSTGTVPELGKLGLVIGIVSNNKDPNNQNRVKVKVPVFDESSELPWARLLTIGGNANEGIHVLPQVNSEVLVAFEHGDINRPIVLGGLWNGRDAPKILADALLNNGKVAQWSVVSGDNVLTLRNADDNTEHMKVTLKDGKTIFYLGADKVELISNDKSIEVKNTKGSILLKDSGDIVLKGPNITIEATTKLTMKAPTVEAKGDSSVKVESGGTLDLKGTGPTKLESSAITEVKGSMVKVN